MMKPAMRKLAERWFKAEYEANYKGKVQTIATRSTGGLQTCLFALKPLLSCPTMYIHTYIHALYCCSRGLTLAYCCS